MLTTDRNGKYAKTINLGDNWFCKVQVKDETGTAFDITAAECFVNVRATRKTAVLEAITPILLSQSTNQGQFCFNISAPISTTLGRGNFVIEIGHIKNAQEIDRIFMRLVIE